METPRAVAPPDFGSVARTITKILRLRRSAASSVGAAVADVASDDSDATRKLKLSKDPGDYATVILKPEVENEQQRKEASCGDGVAMESLLANLFASVSAIKAAYAQLQVAQSPYDPDSIQSADIAVVAELGRVSEMKQAYFNNQLDPRTSPISQPALAAQLQELRNLVKTYKITTHKLEAELELRNSEILALQTELLDSDKKTRALEAKLHPNSSLAALDALYLSGLSPTHFLTALRYAYKSIRSFVSLMVRKMESAGWDLDAAAGSIQPDVLRRNKPGHRTFAFESYVCRRMFSDFHHKSFGLSALGECSAWDRRQFFHDFTKLRSITMNQSVVRGSSLAVQLCRAKYLALVHPKMESAFFGDLEQRAAVSSGRGFPDSEFFAAFSEMARRVWLLHCLFFSFEPETEKSIFQVRRGSRFSEVYMESVTEEDEGRGGGGGDDSVGFTVVPGFRVCRTLIQCKVFLIAGEPKVDGRQ